MNIHLCVIMAIVLMIFSACEKVFEENIDKDKVIILTPADSSSVSSQTITFWWNEIEGATEYELQVVSPNFDSINALLLDTLLSKNKFVFNFAPGKYQCRVRALNSAYATNYTIHSFSLDSTLDLNNQLVSIISPADSFYTNDSRINFSWQPLLAANDYRFEIGQPDFSGTIILDVNLTQTNINYTLDEGIYTWRVRGQNNSSNTGYSTRTVIIDSTVPITPALTSPQNNAVINNDSVSLVWSGESNFLFDSVYVYQDSLATTSVASVKTNNRRYIFEGSLGENYFWRVKTIDLAGNVGQFSLLRKFSFQ